MKQFGATEQVHGIITWELQDSRPLPKFFFNIHTGSLFAQKPSYYKIVNVSRNVEEIYVSV